MRAVVLALTTLADQHHSPGQGTVSHINMPIPLPVHRLTVFFIFRWFCEPAYEKLRNTEEGLVNSRLYSEKAYVLSRGFVRRALELPLGGLESELSWFYHERGRLQSVIRDARELIETSKSAEGSSDAAMAVRSDRAVPRLTPGGALVLSRTLVKLEALWEARTSNVTQGTS